MWLVFAVHKCRTSATMQDICQWSVLPFILLIDTTGWEKKRKGRFIELPTCTKDLSFDWQLRQNHIIESKNGRKCFSPSDTLITKYTDTRFFFFFLHSISYFHTSFLQSPSNFFLFLFTITFLLLLFSFFPYSLSSTYTT